MNVIDYLEQSRYRTERDLRSFLSGLSVAPRLNEAMIYSLTAGGKRIRPALAFAAAEAVNGSADDALPAASALEMIHTYSLIHDDLPAMDDDNLRRGRPTNHRMFGEGIAILAGDGLLTEAFRRLSGPDWRISPERRREITYVISSAAGADGMVGGQALDLLYEGKPVEETTLRQIHTNKTGRLLHASALAGAIAGGADREARNRVSRFGEAIGLAFQIADDLLDVTATAEQMGKATHKDQEKKKATYPSIVGLEESRDEARRLLNEALSALEPLGKPAEVLSALGRFIVERQA